MLVERYATDLSPLKLTTAAGTGAGNSGVWGVGIDAGGNILAGGDSYQLEASGSTARATVLKVGRRRQRAWKKQYRPAGKEYSMGDMIAVDDRALPTSAAGPRPRRRRRTS